MQLYLPNLFLAITKDGETQKLQSINVDLPWFLIKFHNGEAFC